MSLTYVQGNLFKEPFSTVLVNPVNCEGVMGAGLAREFKRHYPEMFQRYQVVCRRRLLIPGKVLPLTLADGKRIICFPTKNSWRKPSRLEWIEAGLGRLVAWLQEAMPDAIAIPPLGCGLGGLDWPDVHDLMERAFADAPKGTEIRIYAPKEGP